MKRAKRDPTNKELRELNLKLREENMALKENWEGHRKLLDNERHILGVFFSEIIATLTEAIEKKNVEELQPVIDRINKLITPNKAK